MFLLTSFNMIILVLLIAYIFYRFIKTKNILTLISFTFQLSAFTIVLLSIINRIETSRVVEVFYLTFGIVCPCCFIIYDYRSMIKKFKYNGGFEGFITVSRNIGKADNPDEIMSVAGNDDFVNETIAELGLLKEELLKGIRKKLIRAEACCKENSYDGAYEIYSGLIGLVGNSANLHFNYGSICAKKGMFSEALTNFRKVLEINEELVQKLKKSQSSYNSSEMLRNIKFKEYLVYYNIGVTYLNLGKMDFALENFRKTLEINPDFNSAKEGIGRILSESGKELEAVEYYEDILEKEPDSYVICLLLGKLYLNLNDSGRAEDCFKRCIRISSGKPDAYSELGKLLMARKNYAEAIKIYRNYCTINQNDYNGHYNLANCYYQTKEPDKAVSEYQKVIELNPKSHNSYFNLALIYEEKQDYEKAEECYKNALLIKIDFTDGYNNLGILFFKQQRHLEALATYVNGIKACPNNYRLYYNMGVVLFDMRRYEDAADTFKKAIEMDPGEKDGYYYLGAALTEQKKYDQAIKAYSTALNENISEGELYYNIAAVYALMKKQDIAIDNLRKAVSINPEIREEIYENNVFDYMHASPEFTQLIS